MNLIKIAMVNEPSVFEPLSSKVDECLGGVTLPFSLFLANLFISGG